MSATKEFFHDCASAGFIPCGNDVFKRLEDLEDQLDLDWIEYMVHPYLGFDDKEYHADGISIDSGVTLHNMGVDIDEISDFLDLWCDYCTGCSQIGRFYVSKHGDKHCAECNTLRAWLTS